MTGRTTTGLTTRALWTIVDAAIWVGSLAFALWLRLDFAITTQFWAPLLVASVFVVSLHIALGWILGPYAIGHELGSFEETSELARTTAVSGGVLAALILVVPVDRRSRAACRSPAWPWPSPACSPHGSSSGPAGRTRPCASTRAKRAIIFGAGSGGRILVQSLVRDPPSGIVPVAMLDDDPRKGRLRIAGLRVRGTRADLARVAERYGATTLVIAVPSATSEVVRDLSAPAREGGLEVLVLPPVREIFGGRPTASDLRNLDVADLLGRQPVDLDMAAIADQITGKRVLVTGAGGSIGSELCRQMSRFAPARARHARPRRERPARHADVDRGPGAPRLRRPGPLRHPRRRQRAAPSSSAPAPRSSSTPPRSSTSPCSSATPARPTRPTSSAPCNVLQAAKAVGVETFVNISTDKAARPTCVLGWSKRVAERLTAGFDGHVRRSIHQRAVRQRPRVPRLGRHRVHGADPARGVRSP